MDCCKAIQKAHTHKHTYTQCTRLGISSTMCSAKEFTGANNSVKCLFDKHNILWARTNSPNKKKNERKKKEIKNKNTKIAFIGE